MTKDELKKELEKQEENINKITNDLEYWMDEHSKLEHEIAEQHEKLSTKWDNFIWKLKSDGLYSDQLQKFIDEYVRFYETK